jgi:hypothetical protein
MVRFILLQIVSAPPLLWLTVAVLIYLYRAAGRWHASMLPDAALLALYWHTPTFGMLLWCALWCAVRHTPALAGEFAVALGLDRFGGWTVQITLFALPALRGVSGADAQERAMPPVVSAAPAPTAATTLLPSAPPTLLLNEGLAALNSDPTAPHSAFIGPTQLGKTTFVGVVLSYRQGTIVITTPKGEQYDSWFGATVVRTVMDTLNRRIDWSPIAQAIGDVHFEMLRRNTPGATTADPLTLVIDELTTTIAQLGAPIAQKIIDILTMGAGSGVRLIGIATDVNARGWKMDGRRDVLDNLVFAKVGPDRVWSLGRMDANWQLLSPRQLETSQVLGLSQRVSLAGRAWAGVGVSGSPGAGVADSLGGAGSAPTVALGVPGAGGASLSGGVVAGAFVGTGQAADRPTDKRTELIAYLKAHPDATRDKARADGCEFDNADYGLIKQAIKRGFL